MSPVPTSPGPRTDANDGEVLVIECDGTGTIVAVDGPLTSWFGYEPSAVIGEPVVAFVHPRYQELSSSLISGMDGKPHLELHDALRIRAAPGGWVWVEATIYGRDPAKGGLAVAARRLPSEMARRLDQQFEANDAIVESERRFRMLADAAPVGVFQELIDGSVYVNRRWQEITGLSAEAAATGTWTRILHPEDAEQTISGYESVRRRDSDRTQGRFRIIRTDGVVRWIEASWGSAQDEDGETVATIGTIDDVTDAVEAVASSARLTHALEATPDLVAIWDKAENCVFLNDAARRFLGKDDSVDRVDIADVVGFLPDAVNIEWSSDVMPELDVTGIWRGEIQVPDTAGRIVPLSAVYLPRWQRGGGLAGIAAICRDITEFKELQAQLDHQATHDPLTGLPNRVLLLDRLEVALARARRDGTMLAVLFLDLDRFKVVNDSLGHALGDRVLSVLASRLEAVLRPAETVARFGGDEFVVLAEDLPDVDAARHLAERLTKVAAEPVDVGDRRFVVSASVGVTTATGCKDTEPDDLIRDADAAMYRAKARGGSRYEFFEPKSRVDALGRLDLEAGLRRAIDLDELRIHLQPTVALTTGKVVGMEALVRWEHPTRGLLGPGEFLHVAEEANLMGLVGRWVIDRSFSMLARLDGERPASTPPLRLQVNLSAQELADPDIVATVVSAAERHGIDPATVDLELTEHTLMEEVSGSGSALVELSGLGYRVAIDDFGTGYSSLAYLRNFPVDLLKIDRTFVIGLTEDTQDKAIVTAVLALAESLGLTVVAEGVEHPGQLQVLRELDCAMAQGYLMSRPLPYDDFLALLVADPTW